MVSIKSLSAAAMVAALVTAGASAQDADAPQGPSCSVTLERTQPDDVFDVTRQVFGDGACNCFIYTGSTAQSSSVENQVTRILDSRRCPGAKPMSVTNASGQGAVPTTGAVAEGSRSAAISILIPATALFAGGIAIALDDDDLDDDDPVSP